MLNKSDQDILISGLPFWNNLTSTQRDTLLYYSQSISYSANDNVHRADSDCIGVLYIKSGHLRVYMLSEEGREITLFRLAEGEICILSASCVLNTITFDVHIDSETDCELIQINSDVYSKLAQDNIYVEAFSHRLTTENFSDVMWAMQQILFVSFDKRLATFLLDETSLQNVDTLQMTHDQIARYLGSAREVVSRMLGYFSSEGYISLHRGKVKLENRKALQELVML